MTEMTGGYGFTGEGNLEGMTEESVGEGCGTGWCNAISVNLTGDLNQFSSILGKIKSMSGMVKVVGDIKPGGTVLLDIDMNPSGAFADINNVLGNEVNYKSEDEASDNVQQFATMLNSAGFESEAIHHEGSRQNNIANDLKNPDSEVSRNNADSIRMSRTTPKVVGKIDVSGEPSKNRFREGKDFPDLTGDGKVTQADILKGRGVELDEDEGKSYQHNGYTYYIDSETGEVTGGPEDKDNKYGFSIKDEGENTWRYEGYGEEVYKSVINNRPLTPSNDPSIENHPYVKTVLNHFFSELPNEELETSKTNLGLEVTDENGIVSISIEIDNGGGVKKYTCDNGKCRFNKD
jgi:hypothetical protein